MKKIIVVGLLIIVVGTLWLNVPKAIAEELSGERFFEEFLAAAQADDSEGIQQLVTANPVTTTQVYLVLLELGQGSGEDAEWYRSLAAILGQFPMVKALEPAEQLNQQTFELYQQGRYEEAIPLAKQALAIREQVLGPEHPDTAGSLHNLAELYRAMGNYAQAEPLSQRALAIMEQVLGPEHPNTALSLNNLAGLYESMGNYAQAEPLHQRALAICEKVFGPEHPHTATSLNNLALLYALMGNYARAEPLYQRALAIREKVLGPEHPDTAGSLHNLAELYKSMGNYAQAEPLYQRALAIWEKVLGPEHPHTALSLNNLATLHAVEGRYSQTWTLFQRAQRIEDTLIDQIMGFTSEAQKLAFLDTKRGNLEGNLTLIVRHLAHDVVVRREGLDLLLRRKGVILEAQKRFQEALFQSGDPAALKVFQELSQVRTQLSQLTFAGPGKEDPESYRQRIEALKSQKDELEAQLSRLSQVFAAQRQRAKADTAQVADALPAHTTLLEFAKIDMFNFKATGQEEKWQPAHYIVFVLHAGQPDKVGLIDLGQAAPIDSAIAEFRFRIKRHDAEDAAQVLYDLVFAPLLPELGTVKDLFISPDSNLNLIPFEVLVSPEGKFLIEEYTFNYLAAGRDLIGVIEETASAQPPVLMGDPDFDFDPGINARAESSSRLKPATIDTPAPEGALASLSFEPGGLAPGMTRSVDMRGFHFKRLPGTKEEVEAIHELLSTAKSEISQSNQETVVSRFDTPFLYTDRDALEAVLLGADAPRILHLATHGFFLEDQDLRDFVRDDLFRASDIYFKPRPQPVFTNGSSIPAQFENPLLRSGIALAGANTATGDVGHSQGIVTAEKILGLKLRGTEMVVLSACETGIGDVQIGEGVYGLRRVFLQAGAKSLVMSLWSVPDTETKELMIRFYQNVLSGKMNRVQALRQAALDQMQVVKDRYGKPHPYYWGAFVFLGDPHQ